MTAVAEYNGFFNVFLSTLDILNVPRTQRLNVLSDLPESSPTLFAGEI